jgi:hypothetical protein
MFMVWSKRNLLYSDVSPKENFGDACTIRAFIFSINEAVAQPYFRAIRPLFLSYGLRNVLFF